MKLRQNNEQFHSGLRSCNVLPVNYILEMKWKMRGYGKFHIDEKIPLQFWYKSLVTYASIYVHMYVNAGN